MMVVYSLYVVSFDTIVAAGCSTLKVLIYGKCIGVLINRRGKQRHVGDFGKGRRRG